MNVLVTGVGGFIGSALASELLKKGFEVIGVDSLTDNYSASIKLNNLKELRDHENFFWDKRDLVFESPDDLIQKSDIIFHLAGQASVQNSWNQDFATYTMRNEVLTHKLLNSAINNGMPKFVFSSSSSIYGKSTSNPMKEDGPKNPVSPYGVSKAAAESLVSLYGTEFGLATTSLRYFTVFGPRQRPDMAFNKLIQAGMQGKPFHIHGDGTQTRDFTFVADVVTANILAATSTVAPGSVFNIGGGSPNSLQSAISIIEGYLGKKITLEKQEFGKGNPMSTEADFSKAKQILGWEPKVTFEEGLKCQVEWQVKNMHLYI